MNIIKTKKQNKTKQNKIKKDLSLDMKPGGRLFLK